MNKIIFKYTYDILKISIIINAFENWKTPLKVIVTIL